MQTAYGAVLNEIIPEAKGSMIMEKNVTPRVLIVSSANMDFVMGVESVPPAGATVIESRSYSYVPGGKGANSAIAFRRLGGDAVFCTRLGQDANGDALEALYRREGIDVSFITRDKETPTGLAAILVEGNGANRIIVYPGSNLTITEESIRAALSGDTKPDALFMQLEIAPEAIILAAKTAEENGIPVFMDAGPARKDFPLDRLPTLEVFSPNETETEVFTGVKPEDDASCLAAAKILTGMVKAKHYVLKLGARGAFVYTPSASTESGTHIDTYHFVKPVDTTAAGDAFTAGLTLEYLRTGDICRAIRYGNVVGTITISRAGASTSIPSEEEIAAFMKEHAIEI